jgi:hypothetical protein
MDVLLAQEVTHEEFGAVASYNVYINVGTEAILIKENTPLNDIGKLPSGRGKTSWFKDIYSKYIRAIRDQ